MTRLLQVSGGCDTLFRPDLIDRYELLLRMFSELTLVDFWKGLQNVRALSLPTTYQLDALLALLKFADGMIHEDEVKMVMAFKLEYFIPIMRELVNFDNCALPWDENFIEKLGSTTSCIQLLLGIFRTCADPSYGPVSKIESTELADILIGFEYPHCDYLYKISWDL